MALSNYNRGISYGRKGEYDKAIADCTEAIHLDPTHAKAYSNRGYSFLNEGQLDKAIADFTEAIRLNPASESAYLNRGMAYGKMGDLEKAIADFTEAIRLNPKLEAAYASRAKLYRVLGNDAKAAIDERTLQELRPIQQTTLPTAGDPASTPPFPVDKETTFPTARDPAATPLLSGGKSIIRARVNNVPIFAKDVDYACLQYLSRVAELPPDWQKQELDRVHNEVLQDLIDGELVMADLHARFEKKSPDFIKQLEDYAAKECEKHIEDLKARMGGTGPPATDDDLRKGLAAPGGITLEGYRRFIERTNVVNEYLRVLIYATIKSAVGRREVLDYYDQHAPLGEFDVSDSVVWLDLFIDASHYATFDEARQMAEQVRARAAADEDFVKLVEQYDQGDSKNRHGEGIGNHRGEIRPADLEPTLFALKAKEVGPIVEISTGFHVVKVTKRENAGRRPLDAELQDQLRNKMMLEMFSRERNRVFIELRRKASIQIYPAE